MEWNIMRLRFLLYLSRTDEQSRSITAMAKIFGISKSTVSRNMEVFADQGIIQGGTVELTGNGKRLAEEYERSVQGMSRYLAGMTGKSPEDMTIEAMHMVLDLAPETRQSILEKQKIQDFLTELDSRSHPKTGEILEKLEDGTYHLPFTIYKENMEDIKRGYVSMSDFAFEHPVTLTVENGNAMICLKAKVLERRSFMEDLIIRGKLLRMKYLEGKEYLETRHEGDSFYFPMSALEFTFHKEEGILQGSTKLMMESPMKKQKHTRAAVFTMFFR